MANWKYRFEEIACEVEGLESPADVREREYKTVLMDQLIDQVSQFIRESVDKNLFLPMNPDILKELDEYSHKLFTATHGGLDFHEDV